MQSGKKYIDPKSELTPNVDEKVRKKSVKIKKGDKEENNCC